MSISTKFGTATLVVVLLASAVFGAGALVGGVAAVDAGDGGDSMENATAIDVGDSTNGTIESTDDADWYTVDVSENQTFIASVAARNISESFREAENRDLELRLYDADGEQLSYSSTKILFYGYGAEHALSHRVVEPGTYYLKVNASYDESNEGAQGYTLNTSAIDSDPYEPNDDRENATQLDANASISAFTVGFDSDHFAVDVDAGDTVTVNYEETTQAFTSHEAQVTAPNGTSLGNDPGDYYGDGEGVTFTATEDGTVYIAIQSAASFGDIDGDDINPYDLTVTVDDGEDETDPVDDGSTDDDTSDDDTSDDTPT